LDFHCCKCNDFANMETLYVVLTVGGDLHSSPLAF
jgi:hypothetical protein